MYVTVGHPELDNPFLYKILDLNKFTEANLIGNIELEVGGLHTLMEFEFGWPPGSEFVSVYEKPYEKIRKTRKKNKI